MYQTFLGPNSIFKVDQQRKAGQVGNIIQGDKASMMETRNEELGQDLNSAPAWTGGSVDYTGTRKQAQAMDGSGLTAEGRQLLNFSQNIFGLEPDQQEKGQMPLGQLGQIGSLPQIGGLGTIGQVWQ